MNTQEKLNQLERKIELVLIEMDGNTGKTNHLDMLLEIYLERREELKKQLEQ